MQQLARILAACLACAIVACPGAHARDGQWRVWDYPSVRSAGLRDPVRGRLLLVQLATPWTPTRVLAMPEAGPFRFEEIPTAGTPPRLASAMFFDPARDALRVLYRQPVFGVSDSVWTLSLGTPTATWSVAAVGPPDLDRFVGPGFVDAAGSRIVFLDTWDSWDLGYMLGYRPEAWALSLGATPTWSLLAADHGFLAYNSASWIDLDPDGRRIVSLGGISIPPHGTSGPVYDLDIREFLLDSGPSRRVPPAGEEHPTAPRLGAYREDAAGRWISLRSVAGGGWRAETIDVGDSARIAPLPVAAASDFSPSDARFLPRPGGAWAALADGRLYRISVTQSLGAERVMDAKVRPEGMNPGSLAFDPRRAAMRAGSASQVGWWELAGDPPVWTANLRDGSSPSLVLAAWDPLERRCLGVDAYGRVLLQDEGGDGAWQVPGVAGTPPWSAPGGRTDVSWEIAYDACNDRYLVVGGLGELQGDRYQVGAWQLRLRPSPAWTPLVTRGAPVRARKGHGLAHASAGDRFYLFGGSSAADAFLHAVPPDSTVYAGVADPGDTLTWIATGSAGAAFPCRLLADPLEERLFVVTGAPVRVFESRRDAGPGLRALDERTDAPPATRSVAAGYDAGRDRIVCITYPVGGDATAFEMGWPLVQAPHLLPEDVGVLARGASAVAACRIETPPHAPRVLRVSMRDRRHWVMWSGLVTRPADSSSVRVLVPLAVPDSAAAGDFALQWNAEFLDVPGLGDSAGASLRVAVPPDTTVVQPLSLELRLVGEQPAAGGRQVLFRLPDATGASLEVYDVRGRLCWSREVGESGPGPHACELGGLDSPGLYWVRLRHRVATRVLRLVRL